jgi:hypothetical protein
MEEKNNRELELVPAWTFRGLSAPLFKPSLVSPILRFLRDKSLAGLAWKVRGTYLVNELAQKAGMRRMYITCLFARFPKES